MCYTSLALRYFSIVVEPVEQLERHIRLDKCIDLFSNSDCYIFFQFNRIQLRRLYSALSIPDTVFFHERRGSVSERTV